MANNEEENGQSGMPSQIEKSLETWMLSLRSEQRSAAGLLVDKLAPEHISAIIENGAKEDKRSFEAFKFEKIVGAFILIFSLIFALALLLLFKDSEYFVTIVTALFSFLGGLGVGKFISPGGKRGS